MELFLLDTLKTSFSMEDLTQEWTQLGLFFPKWGHFFRFSNKSRGGLPPPAPPPSCAPERYFLVTYIWYILNAELYFLDNFWISYEANCNLSLFLLLKNVTFNWCWQQTMVKNQHVVLQIWYHGIHNISKIVFKSLKISLKRKSLLFIKCF